MSKLVNEAGLESVEIFLAGSSPATCTIKDRLVKYGIILNGGLIQLVEYLLCMQKAVGSSPATSTNFS